MYKKILVWNIILWILLLTACQKKVEEPDRVLFTWNGESVDINEGKLYLELTRQAFEKNGGTEVWEMSLQGRDASQTAADKALESLIRTKVLSQQIPSEELTEEDLLKIDEGTQRLLESLDPEVLETIDFSEEQLRSCMEESYRAWKYRTSMIFLPGAMKDELDYQTTEAYAEYDMIDQQWYLRRVELDAIMVYTGEWIHEEWISYPETQQAEQKAKCKEALELLDSGANFVQVRRIYSEDADLRSNRLLHEGVIQADIQGDMQLYRGQIQADLSEKIFKTPIGENTGIIETPYGYMIVSVIRYVDARPEDYEIYRQQLSAAREQFRLERMQEFSEMQFEEEYERLLSEVDLEIHEEVWKACIQK